MRATNEGKTYIKLPFNVVQQNILSNAEINNYPELLEMRKRVTGNTVKLSRKEIKFINKILKEKGLDAPKTELRLGKFGVKDDETLSDDLADMISECDSVTVAFADLDIRPPLLRMMPPMYAKSCGSISGVMILTRPFVEKTM